MRNTRLQALITATVTPAGPFDAMPADAGAALTALGVFNRVMLHAELLSRIWGPEFRDEVQYLRTWVSRIRAKLEPGVPADASQIISTFPGLGYRMEQPPAAP